MDGADRSDVVFEKVGWGRWDARRRGEPARERQQEQQYPVETGVFLQSEEDEDVEMGDVQVDSETETSDEEMEDDDDMTDEEDWAQMGAEVLRMHGGSPISSDGWGASYGSPGPVVWKRTVPMAHFDQKRTQEEREAVEALVKLSSV